jgi:AraC-like DNA-binding protein
VATDIPGLTTVVVADPREANRLIWERLRPGDRGLLNEREACSREYDVLDRRRILIEPESFHSEFSFASIGAMRASRVFDARATQVTVRTAGLDAYGFVLMERGASELVTPRSGERTVGNCEIGTSFDGLLGTRLAASDDSRRFVLWVSGNLLRDKLAVLLDGRESKSLTFRPAFDQAHGPGATIRHMLEFLFVELARSDSLLTNEIAMRGFEDKLALYLLLGLPHSHSQHLQQQVAAAPRNVRRAEEFMRANAAMPLTIADIAHAAGCSVRALQTAFQRFRATTPMNGLRRIRLAHARTEMLRNDRVESVARIAAGHGFSNPSRFAQLFRRTYGAYPSEVVPLWRDVPGEKRDRNPSTDRNLPRPGMGRTPSSDPP